MTAFLTLLRADDAAASRSRVVWAIAGLGAAWAVLIAVLARGSDAATRQHALQADGASLMLLGGLVAALTLGASAFPGDAHSGYLGMLVSAGADRRAVAAARVLARMGTLAGIMALWWGILQLGSWSLGLGFDEALTTHTLAMLVNNGVALAAAALMSSLIGAGAAAAFGLMVFVTAQGLANLKAALDQHVVENDPTGIITPLYVVLPRGIVSPMLEAHQREGIRSLAAPEVKINGLDVIVPASQWPTVVWTLAWIAALVFLTTVGLRRRQL
ncbi:MAG: hypothetical protein KDC33_07540 [Thermoleophilia bacterium]|nr:hypothetical protein [Thermoleophilia bacterium]